MTELEPLAAHLPNPVRAAVSGRRPEPDREKRCHCTGGQVYRRHLFESLSVEKVADAVSLSPSHFSRLFRSTTGFSPHEYIMLHRIDEAKALLQSTSLSVKEIAFRVGYRSEVNFITAFTEKTGATPTQFRRSTL